MPATCANGCVGPWTLASGTDWQYQSGGTVQTSTANPAYDMINAGVANYTLRFTVNTPPAAGALTQVVARYSSAGNFLAMNLYGSGSPAGIQVFDVVGGAGTQIGGNVAITYPASFTLQVNGSSFTLTTPGGNITGTTANTSGTYVGFDLNTAGTSAATMTSLSVKSE
jgi:hypothetical protein